MSRDWKAIFLRKRTFAIALLMIIALLVRLEYARRFQPAPLSGDAANYVAMAKRFFDQGFYSYWGKEPDAYVTPGYPVFLILILKFFAATPDLFVTHVYKAQILISTATVLVLYLIGAKIANCRVGLLAAAAFALYPTSIWASLEVLTETLYIFFFLLHAYIFLIAMERESWPFALLSGVLLGATVAIRPAAAPLLAMPVLYTLLIRRRKRAFLLTLASALGFALLLAPWWIRNLAVLDHFVLFATQAGNPLLAGTDPYFTLGSKLFENISGQDQNQLAYQRIREGFATQPYLYAAWFTVGKLRETFRDLWVVPHGGYFDAFQHIHQWSVYLGFSGFLLYKRMPTLRAIIWMIVISVAVQLMFLPLTRYGYPVVPLLMLLGATVVDLLLRGAAPKTDESPL